MSRAVTSDHILFNECIPYFRPRAIKTSKKIEPKIGYLLLDFRLNEELAFDNFTIEPTVEIKLPGAYSAFIAPVQLPQWFDEWEHNIHLFTIALASVVSFAIGRPVKAPRDGYSSMREKLDQDTLGELSVQFPVLTSGPGSHDTSISKETLKKLFEQVKDITKILYEIQYQTYENAMQSIRLVHLSHLNKREDFGLAYYLLVSAIETVAQKAIKRRRFSIKHSEEDRWQRLAKKDEDIKELLRVYKEERGQSQFLNKRFTEFIMKYSPPQQWHELEHPRANMTNYIKGLTGHNIDWNIQKQWYEKYPEDFNEEEIKQILDSLYAHRSNYTHRGENPPHENPDSNNRFFDTQTLIIEKNDETITEKVTLPNFQLISFIANRSIQNYLQKKF